MLEDGEENEAQSHAGGAAEDEEGDEVEMSREEETFHEAEAVAQTCEQRAKEASDRLSAAMVRIEEPFVCYQLYWVDGLGKSVEDLEAVAAAGVSLRAVIKGTIDSQTTSEVASDIHVGPGLPVAASSGDDQSTALFASIQAACKVAGWDSKLALTVAIEAHLPPSLPGKYYKYNFTFYSLQ